MTTPRLHLLSVALLAVALAGCPKAAPACFDITATANSASTRALFASRRCQGGGVTWGAIVLVLARRLGPFTEVQSPGPGWIGSVYATRGGARFSVDEEGDAARVCADDAGLLARLRGSYEGVNRDPVSLRGAMREAPADALECGEADGTPALR